jgi:hypothetical protein
MSLKHFVKRSAMDDAFDEQILKKIFLFIQTNFFFVDQNSSHLLPYEMQTP